MLKGIGNVLLFILKIIGKLAKGLLLIGAIFGISSFLGGRDWRRVMQWNHFTFQCLTSFIHRALYKNEPPDAELKIIPEKLSKRSEQITYYKDKYVIKGWLGVYKIKSHPEILKLAWDAGIGAKNPQGFGMFEVVNGKSWIVSGKSWVLEVKNLIITVQKYNRVNWNPNE